MAARQARRRGETRKVRPRHRHLEESRVDAQEIRRRNYRRHVRLSGGIARVGVIVGVVVIGSRK